MKAAEFEATLTEGGGIAPPADYADDIPAGQQVKVVVTWETGAVDNAWQRAGRVRFEEAYCAEDAVYEQLIDETSGR